LIDLLTNNPQQLTIKLANWQLTGLLAPQ